MALVRHDFSIDATAALPADPLRRGPVEIAATLVADPALLPERPPVVLAIPGGTYHRRYWDLQPPGRSGYSKAEWLARRGVVFVACDYLGGGDSTRPQDGDFMTLEVAADAAHHVFEQVRGRLEKGELLAALPPLAGATFVGIGQSLGGFITMIQQGKYADYLGVGIFGSSPKLIANIPRHRRLEGLSREERRRVIMEDNARAAGLSELPVYHFAPRDNFRRIFHTPDVPDDLWDYDLAECQSPVSRVTGVDGMTPGLAAPFAKRLEVPVFLAFGEYDVAEDPLAEPTAYRRSPDVSVVVVPRMAHMHNFADTRVQLWRRFAQWLTVVTPSPA
jgi:alpha-beta hydrolase superfamily lysophospholipase